LSSNKIELAKQEKQEMINLIKDYFYNERDEDLAVDLILDFFIEKLAPRFYNKGIDDAYQFMSGKIDDIFELQKSV
jgi:uncharacterized protein (DUF2164 family)